MRGGRASQGAEGRRQTPEAPIQPLRRRHTTEAGEGEVRSLDGRGGVGLPRRRQRRASRPRCGVSCSQPDCGRGELLGLRWQDVDLSAGRLSVVETRTTVAGGEHSGQPKTAAGARDIGIDAGTVGHPDIMAEAHYGGAPRGGAGVDRLRAACSSTSWGSHRIPRRSRDGGRTRSHVRAPVASASTMPATQRRRFELRDGVPVKVVSQRLGHVDVSITLGIYQHVTPADDQAAADALGRLLGGSA